MVVDGIVHPVEDQQFPGVLRKEILVAHPAFDVFLRRRVAEMSVGENVAFLVQAIHPVNPLRVHQICRVPASRRIEDQEVRTVVGFMARVSLRSGQGLSNRNRSRETESRRTAQFQEGSSLHDRLLVEKILLP